MKDFKERLIKLTGFLIIVLCFYTYWTYFPSSEQLLREQEFEKQKKQTRLHQLDPDPTQKIDPSQTKTTIGESSVQDSMPHVPLSEFLKQKDPAAQWMVHRNEMGVVTQVSGGKIKLKDSTQKGTLDFARDLMNSMGLDGATLEFSKNKVPETETSRGFEFVQKVQDYEVDNGYLKVFFNKADDNIYFVTNETKNLGDVDLRIDYRLSDAKRIALKKHSDKQGVTVAEAPRDPVVYNVSMGKSVLVWKITLEIKSPLPDRRLLLVSASDGIVISDISLRSH
ncbi:MAG: hypothetical protein ACK5P6_04130 [Pseudobdellovibrionaceae bacterium]